LQVKKKKYEGPFQLFCSILTKICVNWQFREHREKLQGLFSEFPTISTRLWRKPDSSKSVFSEFLLSSWALTILKILTWKQFDQNFVILLFVRSLFHVQMVRSILQYYLHRLQKLTPSEPFFLFLILILIILLIILLDKTSFDVIVGK
jgi:hypothetical protein